MIVLHTDNILDKFTRVESHLIQGAFWLKKTKNKERLEVPNFKNNITVSQ